MGNLGLRIDKSAINDSFEKVAQKAVKEWTASDVSKLFDSAEFVKRGFDKNSSVYNTLVNKPKLTPAFNKLFDAKNDRFDVHDCNWVLAALRLSPNKVKYLDVLLNTIVKNKDSLNNKLTSHQITNMINSLAQTNESKVGELLSNTDLTIAGAIKAIENNEKTLGLNLIKHPRMKKVAKSYFDNSPFFNPNVYPILSNIEFKLENVADKNIKKHIFNELNSLSKMHWSNRLGIIDNAEKLLDAYNIYNMKYSNVGGKLHNYYKALGEKHPWAKKILLRDLCSSNEGLMTDYIDLHDKEVMNESVISAFKKEQKLDGLKKYVVGHNDSSNMADYMYKQYYLNNLPEIPKQMCLKIMNEFGAKLFYEENHNAPSLVYKELSEWKKAGGREFICPQVIDLTQIRDDFFESMGAMGTPRGIFDHKEKIPTLKGDSDWVIQFALRHELMHGNDTESKVSGIINGVDFDDVQKNSKYKNELVNAGMGFEGLENYAYKNKREFLAVASQGEFSEYSEEFKEVLVKLGMPKWVFNMKQTNPEVTNNALIQSICAIIS